MSEAVHHPDDTDDDPFQVMPAMDEEPLAGLKADIRKNGVEDPVHIDEDGNIIDGHHRVEICDELGIEDYPTKEHTGLTDQEKRDLAYRLNLQQRHLEYSEKQEIVEQYLIEDWDSQETQQEIAEKLGVGQSTVSDAKSEVISELDVIETTTERGSGNAQSSDEKKSDDAFDEDEDDEPQVSDPSTGGDEDEEDEDDEGDESEREQSEVGDDREGSTSSSEDDDEHDDGNGIEQFTSQQTDEWSSPPEVVRPLDDAVDGFDLDPCSGAEQSPFADETYTEDDDGLAQEWFGNVWVNPPYSEMQPWVDKATAEALCDGVETVVFLCKGDSSTQWWQAAAAEATLILAIDGRLSFGDGDSAAPFPSHIVVFGAADTDLVDALCDQGTVLSVGWCDE